MAGGNGTRDSAGRGFPANPGAGCLTTVVYGTTTPALAGIGWTRCSVADSGGLRWSIGMRDRDGSAGRRLGVPTLPAPGGPVVRTPVHQWVVIHALFLSYSISQGELSRFRPVWFRIGS